MNRRDRRAAGRKAPNKPGTSGHDAPASCAAGFRHMQAGRYLDAQICCQQALAIDPDHADSLHLIGLLSLQSQHYDHAAEWIARAIRQDPKAEYLSSLGTALHGLGRHQQALEAIDEATQLKPDDAELWTKRGNILVAQDRLADALMSFRQALALDPRHWNAADRSASALCAMERFDEALAQFNVCDGLRRDHAPTLCMRAFALSGLKRFEEALADNERSYALDPTMVENCNNAGDALQSLGRYGESLTWFERALKLQPDRVEFLNNKAFSLTQLHRFPDALATYGRLASLSVDTALPDWNAALIHLLTGDFEAGWAGREARWKFPVPGITYPKISGPKWLGQENIEGKTILIAADEGLGDSIQFARYVPMVAARGARVILVVAKPVCALLSELPGVSLCLPMSASPLPAFDMHCPISSLPLAFGTRLDTIPSAVSYLPAASASRVEAWDKRLGVRDRPRVGLVWSGNASHANDHQRSISLRTLSRLLDADATFVSLQKDPRPGDRAVLLERTDVLDLTADLTDFGETAALITCLDLVITVDTGVAHLAAAMGCKTWILLPYTPDYRWLLDRDDSPWYPTVRLFRQTETRDYGEVLDRVRRELDTLFAAIPNCPGTGTPESLYEAGLGHMKAGQYLDAQACGEQALAIDSGHADTLHLMGLLSHQAKQYDRAVEWISRAAAQDPKPEYLSNLGTTLRHLGRHDEACEAFGTAARLRPDDAALWKNLGNAQGQLARSAEAVSSFQQVLRLKPDDWDAANKCGMLLDQAGRFEEALAYFNLCDGLRPNDFQTLHRRAMSLCGLKRFEQALGDLAQAHELVPDDIENLNNIGVALQSLNRDDEALEWFEKTLARQPDHLDVLTNKMVSLGRLRRFEEAITTHHRVAALDPENARAELWLGHLDLLTGKFESGWAGHEARSRIRSTTAAGYSRPQWVGEESIQDKTILVHADEGLGDTIHFARYVPMLAARGARVILVVQPATRALLSKLPGVAQCVAAGAETLPAFDLHCPLSSLPLAFGTRLDTIPSGAPYLPVPPASLVQDFENRLGPHDRLRVGLVWSGNPDHDNDHNRSIPLQTLSRIIDVDATFVSLQKDPRPHDMAALRERPDIIDLTADLTDFVATAALLSCLDLVISVDTSVAHLAAASGRPTWILLPYVPDYRWLLDRDDSPWYPTARLFRQTETRDYGDVLGRVRSELQALIAAGDARRYRSPAPTTSPAPAEVVFDSAKADSSAANSAEVLHRKGLSYVEAQQYDLALELFARAIRQDPKPDYISSLGTALQRQGRYEEALKAHDKAVQLKPDDAELWKNLGDILFQLQRLADALLSYQHAVELDPSHWDATYRSAFVLYQTGRVEEALGYVERCNGLRPNQADALQLRGLLQRGLKRYDEYLADSLAAHALAPNDAENQNNIGDALQAFGRYEEAISWFDRALRLRPDYLFALINKGSSLQRLQRFDEAEAVYHHVRAISPGYAEAEFNLALLELLRGDFESGWARREARWRIGYLAAPYPRFSQPMWLGQEDIDGKTILLRIDEGLGDTIQFVRYAPMVAARGARVILVVERPLQALLSGLPGVSQCLAVSGEPLPAFDMHCPITSLPLAFGTRLDTIPATTCYLPPPPRARVQAWEDRLGPGRRLRVGLVWSGNPNHGNDRNRSIPLQTLSRLLDIDATFVSLQKDPRPVDREVMASTDIIDLTSDLTDFIETAALIGCLDLVISVDTSVAHLAAALGCPTWILLPCTPDFRWLLDRDDSPWYPTVRLFRQTATRDYGEVMDRVRSELQAQVAAGELRRSFLSAPTVNSDPAKTIPDPAEADPAATLHLKGQLYLEAHQYDLALEWIARAIRQDPKPEYLLSLATVLQRLGRIEEALRTVDKAVQLRPGDADLWKHLGCMLFEQNRANEALLAFQHVLTLNPDHWEAAEACGFILCQSGRLEEALGCFDRCDRLRPNHAPILAARAVALRGLHRNEEALADNHRAHALAPNDAETCNNLGDVLTQFPGRFEEALRWFDRALSLRPDYPVALRNKGFVLTQLHRFEQAIANYRRMIALDPTDFNAEWNLSIAHMLTGDFAAGWPAREARWKMPPVTYPKLAQPLWLGAEPIAGKTILIYADEGIGDSIQFARYVPMVAALGARVILVVQEPARSLLAGVSGVAECLAKSVAALPAFDVHCPICSLPLAFATRLDSIPSGISYLPRPPAARVQAWQDRLHDRIDSRAGPRRRLRIGLVWSGNPVHKNDHNRSSSLRAFSKLLDGEAIFVSLQKDPRADDVAVLRERHEIIDVTAGLTDFVETAALVSCLDLVITVDTSVAHLAAALGIPTWVLLPYVPDWRWMLDRDDTPWYPTMRLFRQSEAREYGEVLDRIHGALLARIETGAETPDAWAEAGRRHLHDGRFEEAREAFAKALPLRPDDAGLWKSLGNALIALQRPDAALVSLRKALNLDPHDADAVYLVAVTLFRSGQFDDAIAHFDRCRTLQPSHALTLQMRGLSFRALRRYEPFLADSREAHALDPGNVETRNNIGDALQFLGRYDEALEWFDRALDLQPDYIAVLINKASSLQHLHRFDEAAAIYRRIKTFDPDNADADWNLSLLHMLTGDFEAGWARREARWRNAQPLSYPPIVQPMWLGRESVEGKTILVVSDEGLGDAIQFARYLPMLADRGARVFLLVPEALHPLLSAMPGVDRCFAGSADARLEFDMHCPMASLPLAFKTRLDTIPAATSYLPAQASERLRLWKDRLGARDRLRIGLVWSGSPTHANDHHRSIPLRLFSRLADAIDATFVSLQKDPRPGDRAVLAQTDIIDLTADLTDFAETAALIDGLDLVITVDTSVAHLAAALGRPTWILLPYTPDYRWLLDRDDSPWYPTVRLFRQTETRDYASVLDRVRSELQVLIAGSPQRSMTNYSAMQAASPDALHATGLEHMRAGQYDRAVEWFAQAIRHDPKPEYLSSLGRTLQQQGRLDEALRTFDKALQLKPDDATLWANLGGVLVALKRSDEALLSFQQALGLDPRHWDVLHRSGFLLHEMGRPHEALSHLDACDELRPDHSPTLQMRAICLCELGKYEEGLIDIQRAQSLDPANAGLANNVGRILTSLGRDQEALAYFDRAVAQHPDHVAALIDKASSLHRLRRFDEALTIYSRVKRLDPANAEADLGLSFLHLLTGNLEAGWALREARWRSEARQAAYPSLTQPMWLGNEPVEGKTVLVYLDEGLGDTIQFARYVPMLAAQGARVILVVQDILHRLLSSLPGVSECLLLSATATLPAFDLHCSIMSLPLAFATRLDSIPSQTPYLPAPQAGDVRAWEDRLGPRNGPRVGLVWSGNPAHDNDRNRSIPLRTFAGLLDLDATFVSLQKDPRADDQAMLERTGIVDLTRQLGDFADTAALIGSLDLVITVDTSVAHLAGALGRPTWVLLPYVPDWRWLLDRDDSPWYPTVRLFRQTETREYHSVLDRVRSELQLLIAGR